MLKQLHALGLTNLSSEAVDRYYYLSEQGWLKNRPQSIVFFREILSFIILFFILFSALLLAYPTGGSLSNVLSIYSREILIFLLCSYAALSVFKSYRLEKTTLDNNRRGQKEFKINDVIYQDINKNIKSESDIRNLKSLFNEKNILITGAGGSIGSEISRSILSFSPKSIILFENNEFALYQISRELNQAASTEGSEVEIVSILGSVCDEDLLEDIVGLLGVDIIYHTASYKHVPLLEQNCFAAVKNNVFGSYNVAKIASRYEIERAVLISSDKAVRPFSIMGGTKRLSEIIFQAVANTGSRSTMFTSVRFGNVLGSSGSVVPLFREQILRGGPVTITHPDVVRYFMSIDESVYLILLASLYSENEKIAVLDMGEPIKIFELASRMIRGYGFSIKDDQNPDGDIEIVFTGLRPGEKLYEELLIGDNVSSSKHQKIMLADDEFPDWEKVEIMLSEIEGVCYEKDEDSLKRILQVYIPDFSPPDGTNDVLSKRKGLMATQKKAGMKSFRLV